MSNILLVIFLNELRKKVIPKDVGPQRCLNAVFRRVQSLVNRAADNTVHRGFFYLFSFLLYFYIMKTCPCN